MTAPRLLALILSAGCGLTAAAADDPTMKRFADRRKKFDNAIAALRADTAKSYDRLIEAAGKLNASAVSAGDRATTIKELKAARDEFVRDGQVTPVPALHEAHVKYLTQARKEAVQFSAFARDLTNTMKAGDPRRAELSARATAARQSVSRSDLLQAGTAWDGYRGDFGSPATWSRAVNPLNLRHSRYTIHRPGAVNAEWDLRVTARDGDRVEGVVTQAGGRAKWHVAGTFDGVNLAMATDTARPNGGMIRGDRREFVYQGVVVGGVGFFNQDGVKTNGQRGAGQIMLELRQ